MTVQIDIVQKKPNQGNHEMIRAIRKSSREMSEQLGEECAVDSNVQEAQVTLRKLQQQLERGEGIDLGILVLLGFTDEDIADLKTEAERSRIELICFRLNWECDRFSADMNAAVNFGNEKHIGKALRKSWLRGRLRQEGVTIRPVKPEAEELERYLSLRYTVYKEEKYIPLEIDSAARLEVNCTDRWALPVGVFAKDGELIGCIRLVYEFGRVNEYTAVIDEVVRKKTDTPLNTAWETEDLQYPFDLCKYFADFGDYYSKKVRDKVVLRKAEISRVIVLKKYRRHGIGEVLVDTMISIAQKRGVDLLFLACKERHSEFYKNCGFVEIPGLVCENFGQYGVRAIAMDRRI